MLPTVADVLELEPVRRGAPQVLAGADRLDTPVRWVHVIELTEAGRLLRGGELVLSTGIALPPDPAGLGRYVAGLAAAGVSALAVELGSRYVRALPGALVDAAVRHRLPLIVFERETQFIAITEAVHGRILAAQVAELSAADRVYQVFTDLALSGASEQEVVERASELAGVPVILADLGHRVLACAGAAADELLAGFAGKSRAVRIAGRTGYDKAAGWLVTAAGNPSWGRLIFVLARAPQPADEALLERAAATLTLTRMVGDRRRTGPESPARTAGGVLFRAVAGPGYADWGDLHARITAFGVPLTGQLIVPVVILAAGTPAPLAAALGAACEQAGVAGVTGVLDGGAAGGLLALPAGADVGAVLTEVAALATGPGMPVGTAAPVDSLAEARAALREAELAAGAAAWAGGVLTGSVVRLADLGLAGLLYQLRDDPRVLAYSEGQLEALLAHDERHGTDLVQVLTIYLEAGGNKALASARAGLARPTLYDRLRKIEQLVGASLESAQVRLDLHVALLALICPYRSDQARDG